jgi:tRNA A-37 threonylcarbamoyl transferase component Bud32
MAGMGSGEREGGSLGTATSGSLAWRGGELSAARGWASDEAAEVLGERAARPAEMLAALFAARPAAWLRRMPLRETFAWPTPDGPLVAKRFVGDPEGSTWAALAWWAPRRSPARREAENLLQLRADGFPVPRAVAWWEEPNPAGGARHAFGRSAVLMQLVRHGANLRQVVERDPRDAARAWLRPLAKLVARLHDSGWYHRDLYLHHVVLAGEIGADAQLVLLDLGRARKERSPRRRWFVKDLAALQMSTPAELGARPRLRFVAAYARARGLDRAEARSLARAAFAKARRMAAHVPRHVDPDDALRGSGA